MIPASLTAGGLGTLEGAVVARIARFETEGFLERLRAGDPLLWVDDPATPEIADRLGWVTVQDEMAAVVPELESFAASVKERFDRVVLCGMGGSSLAPEVIARSCDLREGYPHLVVLDSTHPDSVAAAAEGVAGDRILYLISSKSGTTIETLSFFEYFWDRSPSGSQFVAITDPGSWLAGVAEERGFLKAFINPPDIGGRYSAMSYFGMVPAALCGADAGALIESAGTVSTGCLSGHAESPGLWLGTLLGAAAMAGRDKLTLLLSPRLASLGGWIEQLVAESTGKGGVGLLPVAGEPLGNPESYGEDRLFVRVALAGEESPDEEMTRAIRTSGAPFVELALKDPAELGGQFYLWEFATAVAGAVMRLNPFDQPNVAESKSNTNRVLASGIPGPAGSDPEVSFFDGLKPGDYVAFLVYGPMSAKTDAAVNELRVRLRDRYRVATTAGYGPRYLHSTGQLHKGGAAVGRFVLVVDPISDDLPVPGREFTFGELMRAQAEGDAQALESRGLPVMRVGGLEELDRLLE